MSVDNRRPLTRNERLYLTQRQRISRHRTRGYAVLLMAGAILCSLIAAVPLRAAGFPPPGIIFVLFSASIFGGGVVVWIRSGASRVFPTEVVTFSGVYRIQVRRKGTPAVRFVGEQSVSLPDHWTKRISSGASVTVEACACPGVKQRDGSIATRHPAYEVVSLNGTYTVDREVPLGLLKLKGAPMSLGIACVLGLFVVMFSVPLVDLRVVPWESVRTLTSRLNAAGLSEDGTERAIERPVSAAEFFSLVFSACFLVTLPFLAHGLIILARDRAITKTIGRYYQSEG